MPLNVERVRSDEVLPDQVDVVIIGGGIAGVAAGYELVRQGHTVALLEKGVVAAEQSSRNWGWCRKQNRDEREIPLIKYSLKRWAELAGEINADPGFRPTGITYVSTQQSDVAQWEAWNNMARKYDIDSRMLSAAEAAEMSPGTQGKWIGGATCPSDGRAEPTFAVPVIASAAQRAGMKIFQHCAARGLERSAGRVSAVVTERGTIRTQAVICAGGAWAAMFCRANGISLPQAGVYATAMRTEVAPEVLSGGLSVPGLTVRRRVDGGYTLGVSGRGRVDLTPQGLRHARAFWPTYKLRRAGVRLNLGLSFLQGPESFQTWRLDGTSPFEEMRVYDPAPDPVLISQATVRLAQLFPALKGVKIAEAWAGLMDSTPDTIPVISAVPSLPGFYLSTGYSGHGFGIGLGAGRLMADLVTNQTPIVAPGAFRYERLIDGTDLGKPGMI